MRLGSDMPPPPLKRLETVIEFRHAKRLSLATPCSDSIPLADIESSPVSDTSFLLNKLIYLSIYAGIVCKPLAITP